jgi:hypothetical protein
MKLTAQVAKASFAGKLSSAPRSVSIDGRTAVQPGCAAKSPFPVLRLVGEMAGAFSAIGSSCSGHPRQTFVSDMPTPARAFEPRWDAWQVYTERCGGWGVPTPCWTNVGRL